MISIDCIDPPPLDEIELSQFADGEAQPKAAAHIENCAFCRANAEQIASQQQSLKSQLFRSTCPNSEELRDFQMALLDRTRDNFVALHTASCPHCARELSVLHAYLDDPLLRHAPESSTPKSSDEQPSLVGRLQLLVANLVQPGARTALTGIRGGDEPIQTFRAGSGQIGIETQADDERPSTLIVQGLVTGIELAELTVHLWRDDQLAASEPVDELLGDFVIRGLTAGDYEMTLQGPDLVIRIPSLKIGE